MSLSPFLSELFLIKTGQIPKPEKKKTQPIPKRSKTMKAEYRKYIPAMLAFLALPENKYCRIRFQGCGHESQTIHHIAGRVGANLHDQKNWLPSCLKCNITLESKDFESRERGILKSKLTPYSKFPVAVATYDQNLKAIIIS